MQLISVLIFILSISCVQQKGGLSKVVSKEIKSDSSCAQLFNQEREDIIAALQGIEDATPTSYFAGGVDAYMANCSNNNYGYFIQSNLAQTDYDTYQMLFSALSSNSFLNQKLDIDTANVSLVDISNLDFTKSNCSSLEGKRIILSTRISHDDGATSFPYTFHLTKTPLNNFLWLGDVGGVPAYETDCF